MVAMVVGSFTQPRPFFQEVGRGLSLLDFDVDTGVIRPVDLLESLPSPAYLRPFRTGLLAVCEAHEGEAALAFVSVSDGRLVLRGRAAIPGDTPCHVDIDPSGAWAACACYGSGHVTVHGLDSAGVPSDPVSMIRHAGTSVHPVRQTGPHAHACRFSPDGKWLLVADLGTDEVWCHRIANGALQADAERWSAHPGSGPRMLSFSPDGRTVILVMELTSEVASLSWQDGALRQIALAPTLIGENGVSNTAAGLRWHPSGTLFAASNRGEDSIALFRLDPASGAINAIGGAPCGGAKPRDFEFSPCGRWLVVANQDSGTLAVFALDGERLVDAGSRFAVECPSCVRFL